MEAARIAGLVVMLMVAGWDGPALAAELPSTVSDRDAAGALRQALTKGADAAVGRLGVVDGFLGNPKVRIPLPAELARADRLLRIVGYGPQLDELVTAMNRAAEAAVPEARTLLVDAVKRMSVEDARGILTGGDDAATQYFRKATQQRLAERFLPVVKQRTDALGVAQQYNAVAGSAVRYGVLSPEQATIEQYVTGKALDGLYLMIAEEERAIRKDPLGQASRLLRRVFGAISP